MILRAVPPVLLTAEYISYHPGLQPDPAELVLLSICVGICTLARMPVFIYVCKEPAELVWLAAAAKLKKPAKRVSSGFEHL